MLQKVAFSTLAEKLISEQFSDTPKPEIKRLSDSISKLMQWAYVKGVDRGIEMSELDKE